MTPITSIIKERTLCLGSFYSIFDDARVVALGVQDSLSRIPRGLALNRHNNSRSDPASSEEGKKVLVHLMLSGRDVEARAWEDRKDHTEEFLCGSLG